MTQPIDPALQDFSTIALASAVKRNLYALFQQFRYGQYASTRTGAGWYAWRSPVPYVWFNGVLVDRAAQDVDEVEIDAALRLFAGYGEAISWWLAPEVAVAPWQERLAAHGMAYEADTPGMALDLNALDKQTAVAPTVEGLEIRAIASTVELRTWSAIFVEGYGLPADWQDDLFDMCQSWGLDLPLRYYLGLLHGEAVATSMLLLGAGVAGVYNVATLPSARKRGIGEAMTRTALVDGRQLGYSIGALQSSAQGYPIYRHMGFTEVCKIDLFVGHVSAT